MTRADAPRRAKDVETVVLAEPRAAGRQAQTAEHYEPHRAEEKYPPVMLSVDELTRISTTITPEPV
ncbi:hypothetical protein ACTXKL_13555 [Brachybacterium tyrofermentans]|uniref:hypothetical protein n=1 Tax=Brachybacterium tyrofermentans TaxID=47848 RepID=UPI003FD2288F